MATRIESPAVARKTRLAMRENRSHMSGRPRALEVFGEDGNEGHRQNTAGDQGKEQSRGCCWRRRMRPGWPTGRNWRLIRILPRKPRAFSRPKKKATIRAERAILDIGSANFASIALSNLVCLFSVSQKQKINKHPKIMLECPSSFVIRFPEGWPSGLRRLS